jgi:hypothetical protein
MTKEKQRQKQRQWNELLPLTTHGAAVSEVPLYLEATTTAEATAIAKCGVSPLRWSR